jgi:hypothetical protein
MVGSAYKNKGVQLLLDAVTYYLPNPTEKENIALDQNNAEEKVVLKSDASLPFVALAFKLDEGRYGQLTYMRIYQGRVGKGDTIFNAVNDRKVKVPRLVQMHADEMNDVEEACAGDIVAFFGVDCASGDTFTDGRVKYTMTSMFVPNAVISLAQQRFTENLWTDKLSLQRPQLVAVEDDAAQARWVADCVLAHREAGLKLKAQAVLFRTAHHSAALELELARRNRKPIVMMKVGRSQLGGAAAFQPAHQGLEPAGRQRHQLAAVEQRGRARGVSHSSKSSGW